MNLTTTWESKVEILTPDEIPELLTWAQRHKLVLYDGAMRNLLAIRDFKNQGLHVCGDTCRVRPEAPPKKP